MTTRRVNDALVDRLIAGLGSLTYRQKLAHRLSLSDNITYRSAMRRLQRYITTAGERRSYQSAPAPKRISLRKAARQVPLPPGIVVPVRPKRVPLVKEGSPPAFYKPPEHVFEPGPDWEPPVFQRTVGARELDAIVAYHDGDIAEAADTLDLSARAREVLELTTSGIFEGFDPFAGRPTAGTRELESAVREFFAEHEDAPDVEDFIDLIGNIPAWQMNLMLQDMRAGKHEFSDWHTAWIADGKVFRFKGDPDDTDLSDSYYWAVFRELMEDNDSP